METTGGSTLAGETETVQQPGADMYVYHMYVHTVPLYVHVMPHIHAVSHVHIVQHVHTVQHVYTVSHVLYIHYHMYMKCHMYVHMYSATCA